MGAVESVLREVEKVTVRPLGEVARTVERVTIRPLGEVAREVEKVTVRPLGQVLRGTEKIVTRPVTELAKDTVLMVGRALDLVKPDRDVPPNTDMRNMESTIRKVSEEDINKVVHDQTQLQGDIRETILQTPSGAGDSLSFLDRLGRANDRLGVSLVHIQNHPEIMQNNEELTREHETLMAVEDELTEILNELNNS